jgi:8-oxo-dGTP pyrophosphatase MutT (NUDIX family)
MSPSRPPRPAIPTADVQISVGVVDVVVLAPAAHGRRDRWRVLTLRRAVGVRCTGAWELVHGSIEPGERPADAARREVLEETGLRVQRLYTLAVNPFYLTSRNTIQMAVVFAAVVEHASVVTLSLEHDSMAWRTATAAIKHLAWPREHEAVRYAIHLLRDGDAGAVEDVLRVPDA